MYRLTVAALAGLALSVADDETSLIQGFKPSTDVIQRNDKSKAITGLLSTATTMLKNGATPDVVIFAKATLDEIAQVVLPAITDAHDADQKLVTDTFAMFEAALADLEAGVTAIKLLSDEERKHSTDHKKCRGVKGPNEDMDMDSEKGLCYIKRECDYDLYAVWKKFSEEEETLRQHEKKIDGHFCVEKNGTAQIFRSEAILLFPDFIYQKPIVEKWEFDYEVKRPDCETKIAKLDDKTELCDADQTELEKAACAHAQKVREVRDEFSAAWDQALLAYQNVVNEVHCLEIDRWKEWRSLKVIDCLLDETTARNGRPCDEETGETEVEVARCEGYHTNATLDHLTILYYQIPPMPLPCAATPWDIEMANPGRCIPQIPHTPCSGDFFTQEYLELWIPPQPEFFGGVNFEEGNSHCNQRQDCVVCTTDDETENLDFVLDGNANDLFVLPAPEHECHFATRFQIATNEYADHTPDAATCQIPVATWKKLGDETLIHFDDEKAWATKGLKTLWEGSAACEGNVIVFTFVNQGSTHVVEFAASADKRTLTYADNIQYTMQ